MAKFSSTVLVLSAVALCGCGKSKKSDQVKPDATATIISNKLAAIAAAGEPVSAAELNKWYVEPPTGENAAEIYLEAFAALTEDDPSSTGFVAKNEKALALLLRAAERKSSRYPVDFRAGYAAKLPHLLNFNKSAKLLSSSANIEAASGRTATATKQILAGIRLTHSLDNEPALISRLVQVASLKTTLQGLEQALARRGFRADQISELQQGLHNAQGVTSFHRVLAGERAVLISFFTESTVKDLEILASMSKTNLAPIDLVAYTKTTVYQEDFDFALDWMSALLKRADKPFPESLETGDEPKFENASGQKFIFSTALLPALGESIDKAARLAALLRIAQAALAVERFRLQHANALPESLNALSPAFIASIPNDPFDGQPIRYKKLPAKGYVVYSVGKDRRDDGGMTLTGSKSNSAPDITFTIRR